MKRCYVMCTRPQRRQWSLRRQRQQQVLLLHAIIITLTLTTVNVVINSKAITSYHILSLQHITSPGSHHRFRNYPTTGVRPNIRSVVENTVSTTITTSTVVHYSRHNSRQDISNDDDDDDSVSSSSFVDTAILRHRMYPIQMKALEQVFERSPSYTSITYPLTHTASTKTTATRTTTTTAMQFIELCLHCLLLNDEPYPDAGIRFLLRVSTPQWKQQIVQSIGYNHNNNNSDNHQKKNTIHSRSEDDVHIVSAISSTITQRNNQFGILVGEGERYTISFPTEPLEYEHCSDTHDVSSSSSSLSSYMTTGTATTWMECQLRDYETNELLVVMGWQLVLQTDDHKRQTDDDRTSSSSSSSSSSVVYLIDRVDWQDFRAAFRPGIGREEWMRICG
jgi:hypothetical protein